MSDFLKLAGEIAVEPYSRLYAHRGAGLAVMLTWDREGLWHCATVFDRVDVGQAFWASDGWTGKWRPVDWSTFERKEAANDE